MCFRKKRRDGRTFDAAVLRDKDIVEENIKSLEVLEAQFEANKEILAKITALKEKYKFVSPLPTGDARDCDKSIASRLDDIKIIAAKSIKHDNFSEVEDIIQKIKILIAERGK